MGHGASVDITNISPEDAKRLMIELETTVKHNDEEKSSSGHHHGTETSTRSKRVRQQKNIFSEAANYQESDLQIVGSEFLDDKVKELLKNALGGFYFFKDNIGSADHKIELVMRAMTREEISSATLLINEGEPGNKLYIVESGELEVTINGDYIRTMSVGSMLGELALLYDAPRSATVRCISNCVLWSLHRDLFKKIQSASASAVEMNRKRWLIQSPVLAILSEIDLSRLVSTLKANQQLDAGIELYGCGQVTKQISIIESGFADVYTHEDLSELSLDEIDKTIGISRPRGCKKDPSYTAKQIPGMFFACTLTEGCVLGIEAMRSKAGFKDSWQWISDENTEGVECPVTVVASSEVFYSSFNIDIFENLFGPVDEVLRRTQVMDSEPRSPSMRRITSARLPKREELKFDSTRFKMKCVYGSGSFGVVIAAEYKDFNNEITQYALKVLTKVSVIETGQLRHVLDERKLLSQMNSRFVLRLYGTYQTPHQLVMVTEPLNYGDLWNVIYEVTPYCEQDGISLPLATFYVASLVIALAHIHGHGVVFRDLKPENILLDGNGYIRIIDFGFAKKVPYTKVDSTGVSRVHAKTYTLCGTPEYLAPELIFNLGHDQAADIWALGVVMHEMLMAVTPFASKNADNVTELFTNIAMVRKIGLQLSPRWQEQVNDPIATSLITELLMGESVDRIGVKEGRTSYILQHPFFSSLDIDALKEGTVRPEHIPDQMRDYADIRSLAAVKAYKGDQSIFEKF